MAEGKVLDGYQCALNVVRGDDTLVMCHTAGTGGAAGSSRFVCAHTAAEVYPVIQDMFPRHGVSRLDACEDYSGERSFEKLEAMLLKVARENGISVAPYGEGHIRPDGVRDPVKGRTWYFGSPKSAFRIVLYEKGKKYLSEGIPADPDWARLEVRVRPNSKAKHLVGSMGIDLVPHKLFSMSRWGVKVAELLGVQELARIQIGSVWRPNEQEQLAQRIVNMFDRGLEELLKTEGSAEAVGRLLFNVQSKTKEAKAVLYAEQRPSFPHESPLQGSDCGKLEIGALG
jgi:hypothetical protein